MTPSTKKGNTQKPCSTIDMINTVRYFLPSTTSSSKHLLAVESSPTRSPYYRRRKGSRIAYAPGIIAVNVTWIERKFNACQTHRSMYTSIFNRLRAIARYWSEIATFSYPLHLTPPYGVAPWDNRGKCYMLFKRLAACIPIYLQPFPSNSSLKFKSSLF